MIKECIFTHNKQQGVVLAVTLIMLVLITLLAVSGMRSTVMEERMANNSHNKSMSFQMAETALRQAEFKLRTSANVRIVADANANSIDNVNTCMYNKDSIDFTAVDWSTLGISSCDYTGTADDTVNGEAPEYFIEFLNFNAPAMMGGEGDCFYRITARGYGPDKTSQTTLQEVYKFSSCS